MRRGILFMLVSIVFFSLMYSISKGLTETYPVLQIVWARYVLFVGFSFAPALRFGAGAVLRTRRLVLQVVRSALLVGATACALAGYSYLHLADANALGSISPLLVTLLSALVLGEAVGWRRWLAIAGGFAGTLIILRPGAGAFDWAALLPVCASALYANYQITTRMLSNVDSEATTLFYSGTVGAIALTLLLPFIWVPPDLEGWAVLLLVAVLGTGGQVCVIRALTSAPASSLQPYAYVQLPFMALVGFVLYDEVPDFWTYVGAAVVVASGLYAWHRSRVKGG